MKKFLGFITLASIMSCSNNNDDSQYISLNNELLMTNIIKVINKIQSSTENEYYFEKANIYKEIFQKAIHYINNDKASDAIAVLKDFDATEGVLGIYIKDYGFLSKKSSIDKEISKNRLLLIEYLLMTELYSMKTESNFEFNRIKLLAIGDSKKEGEVYEAKLVLIGINSEKNYKVVIGNDTITNYTEKYFPVYKDKTGKKGTNNVKATVLMDMWGTVTKYPLEFSYEVK